MAASIFSKRGSKLSVTFASCRVSETVTSLGPVTMDRFSKPFHELGGLFVDFRANRSRTLTIRSNVGLEMISAETGRVVPIQLPRNVRVSNSTWSPDGRSIAFFGHTDEATHIWVADAATGRARP